MIRFIPLEPDAPRPQRSALKPGVAFIDPDGDLNIVLDNGQIVFFDRDAAAASPDVRGSTVSTLPMHEVVRILPPGTRVTLEV